MCSVIDGLASVALVDTANPVPDVYGPAAKDIMEEMVSAANAMAAAANGKACRGPNAV